MTEFIQGIVFSPIIPVPLLVAFFCVTTVATVFFALRRASTRGTIAALLRLAAAALLVVVVLDPQIRRVERQPLGEVAIVLTDRTGSQELGNRATTTETAREALLQSLQGIENLEIVEAEATGTDETRIGAALAPVVGATPREQLAGVFVVTDGQSADQIDPSILPEEAPLHVLFTGAADEKDRKLTMTDAPRYGIVKQPVTVGFRIDDLGPDGTQLPSSTDGIEVVLRVNGEEAIRQRVPVNTEIQFAAPLNRPGETIIELEAEGLEGELTPRNNGAVLRIQAVRDRLRVLLVSGEPHPGERVWRNLLKSDPAIDLVHFTILRPAEKQARDGVLDQRELALIEFPYDELFIEKLSEFDLLIFDRYTYRGVLNAFHFENIARYVERGGAVLVSSGPEFFGPFSLAARRNFSYILPVTPTGPVVKAPYRPTVTDLGNRHPVTEALSDEGSWGRWLRTQPSESRSGQIVMSDENDNPLLVFDRVGEGRVGMLLSDHVWLWARGFDGGGPHAELLRRVSHWLMKEPALEEERLELIGRNNELIIRKRTLRSSPDETTITQPDDTEVVVELTEVSPGVFEGRLEDAARGLYSGRSGDAFAVGEVGLAAPPEFQDVIMDRRPLEQSVGVAKGGTFTIDQTGSPDIRLVRPGASRSAGDNWAGITDRNANRIVSSTKKPFAHPAVWLFVIATFLLGAWIIESGTRKESVN
ncbi:MAG: hypothetical protein AAGH38_03930 [Pseudomonadota bacterium]